MNHHCHNCRLIKPYSDQFVEYAHLKFFYSRYSDDELTHNYYLCPVCSQLWREDDCSYIVTQGYFWVQISSDIFLKWESGHLPQEVQHTEEGILNWINSSDGGYNVGLFS